MKRRTGTRGWYPARRHTMWVRGLRSRQVGRRARSIGQLMCFLNRRLHGRVTLIRAPVSLSLVVRNEYNQNAVETIRSEIRRVGDARRPDRTAPYRLQYSTVPETGSRRVVPAIFSHPAPTPLSRREQVAPARTVLRETSLSHPTAIAPTSSTSEGSSPSPQHFPNRPRHSLTTVTPAQTQTERSSVESKPGISTSFDDGATETINRIVHFGMIRRELTATLRHIVPPTPLRTQTDRVSRRPASGDEKTTAPTAGRLHDSRRENSGWEDSGRPVHATGAITLARGLPADPVAIVPLRAAQPDVAPGQTHRAADRDPPPLVMRRTQATPSSGGGSDPMPDETRIRKQVTETVERTVREVVERRLVHDSRLGRHLTAEMRSQLYQDLILERERLGVG